MKTFIVILMFTKGPAPNATLHSKRAPLPPNNKKKETFLGTFMLTEGNSEKTIVRLFRSHIAVLGTAMQTRGFRIRPTPSTTTATPECPAYCPLYVDPVCGMQQDCHGHWLARSFSNSCFMFVANQCEGGRYIPCDDRVTGTESPPPSGEVSS